MNLIARPASHLGEIQLYPDVASRSVDVSARAKVADNSTLTVAVSNPEGKQVAVKTMFQFRFLCKDK